MFNRRTLKSLCGATSLIAAAALAASPPPNAPCYVLCNGALMPAWIVDEPASGAAVTQVPFVRVIELANGLGPPRERLISSYRLRNIQRDLKSRTLPEWQSRRPRMVRDQPFYGASPFTSGAPGCSSGLIYDGYGVPFAFEDSFIARRLAAQQDSRRAFNTLEMAERKAQLLGAHEKALKTGLGLLSTGEYQKAVMVLTLAAELNQADPACRIHLAQARLALGHFDEAGLVLRRALQLQPKLLYVPLNLSESYSTPEVFDRHVDALRDWTRKNEPSADTLLLLAYLELQRGDCAAAHAASRRVTDVHPRDELARTVASLTRPAR